MKFIPVVMLPQPGPERVPVLQRVSLPPASVFEYRRGAVCLSVSLTRGTPAPRNLRQPARGEFRRIFDLALALPLSPINPRRSRG